MHLGAGFLSLRRHSVTALLPPEVGDSGDHGSSEWVTSSVRRTHRPARRADADGSGVHLSPRPGVAWTEWGSTAFQPHAALTAILTPPADQGGTVQAPARPQRAWETRACVWDRYILLHRNGGLRRGFSDHSTKHGGVPEEGMDSSAVIVNLKNLLGKRGSSFPE